MSQPYSVHTADIAANSNIIKTLWLEGFAQSTPASTQRKLEQMYLANPAGQGLCCLLREEKSGDDVGVQCLVQRKFYYASQVFNAGIMADYVVLAKHRSLGPALQLLKSCTSRGKSYFDFMYGFPNTKSELIFQRAGLNSVGHIVRYAKLLRSHTFLRGSLSSWLAPMAAMFIDLAIWFGDHASLLFHSSGIECCDISEFDKTFDQLWGNHKQLLLLVSDRSAQALAWRYPDSRHRNVFATKDKKYGNLLGYCIWSRQNDAAIIHDFFCNHPIEHLEILMRAFSRQMRRQGASSISLEFFGPTPLVRLLLKAGLVAREKNPIYGVTGESIQEPTEENWYLTSFDRDTD